MKIVLIDDDQTILDLVAQFLRLSSDHTVHSELSAKAALDVIVKAEQPFDCLLVDIQMPEVDGIKFVGAARELPGYRDTPIIMLTAMHERIYLDRAFSSGATDYVAKPIDFMDLHRRLGATQKLVEEMARFDREQSPARQPRKDAIEETKEFELYYPLPLVEMGSSIDNANFENYLRQLQHRRFQRSSVVVEKIGLVETIFTEFTSNEFRSLVHEVAHSLEEELLAEGGVLSYRGNGLFVCIPKKILHRSRGHLETRINRHFHVLRPPNGRIGIWLLVGEPVILDRHTTVNALEPPPSPVQAQKNG